MTRQILVKEGRSHSEHELGSVGTGTEARLPRDNKLALGRGNKGSGARRERASHCIVRQEGEMEGRRLLARSRDRSLRHASTGRRARLSATAAPWPHTWPRRLRSQEVMELIVRLAHSRIAVAAMEFPRR